MTIIEAAQKFDIHRTTILALCHDPVFSARWGCIKENGRWNIQTPPAGDKWYKPKRVAQIMGKSTVQIFRLCKIGALRSVRLGKAVRIEKSEAIKMLERRY